MQIRGKFVPLIDVREELDVADYGRLPGSGVAILVETEKGSRSALLVDAIQDRERDLKRRLQDLQIEFDRASHAREVTQITTSDFFQSLQGNAERIRARMRGQDDAAGGRSDAAGD